MKITDTVYKFHKCTQYAEMLEGLNAIILKAPKSAKRDILADMSKYGMEVCDDFKKHLNSVDYLLAINTSLEIDATMYKREVKEKDIEIVKLNNQIKELLK